MLSNKEVETLKEKVRGSIYSPKDKEYADLRTVYSASVNKHPKLIVQCSCPADVVEAVQFGRKNHLPISVRGGGHSGPGYGVCDDGLVIDLSKMNEVKVDPKKRQAKVGGGALLRDLDGATHAHGLAVPAGINSTTGVGGLTLGGGHGYLSRKFGLTVDSLIGAELVLADGRLVTASETENQDLFWAIRGGGGNFGVVTSFLFTLHPVRNIYGGPTFWNMEDATQILQWYRDFTKEAPDDVYGFFSFHTVPSSNPFPESIWGKKMCGLVWCCTISPEEAERILSTVLERFPPVFQYLAEMPYPTLQSLFDPFYPKGMQWYWKGNFVDQLPDAAIALHLEHADKMPTGLSTMHLYPINGRVHERNKKDMAFAHRDSLWSQVIVGVDPDPGMFDTIRSWARGYWGALKPFSAKGGYLNFMMEEGTITVKNMYGDNYDRLVAIKRKYDPENVFRSNQNIEPKNV